MMISDADFDDLFPKQPRHNQRLQAPDQQTAPSPATTRLPIPAHAGIMAAMLPAMATYGAIFNAYGKAKNT